MSKLTSTEIFHSNEQTEMGSEMVFITLLNTTNIRYNERNQIYLQSKSNIESSHRISKLRRNPNPKLNNLVIGFCH